jgi:hypothetical protein
MPIPEMRITINHMVVAAVGRALSTFPSQSGLG